LDVKTRFKGGKATAKIIKSGASLAGWDDALSLEAKIELIIKEPYTKRYTIWRTILACQENIKWFANEQSEKFPETAITQHFELLALSSQRMQDCLKAEGFSLSSLSTYPKEREWRVGGEFVISKIQKDIDPGDYYKAHADWALENWTKPVHTMSNWALISLESIE